MLVRLSPLVAVGAATLVCGSCERHQLPGPPPDAVIVRVYRDRESDFAGQLDRKLYDFTGAHHTTSSGRWIFVATVEPYHYSAELGGKVATIKPQLVVLDRASDAGLIRGMDVDVKQAVEKAFNLWIRVPEKFLDRMDLVCHLLQLIGLWPVKIPASFTMIILAEQAPTASGTLLENTGQEHSKLRLQLL